MKTKKVKVGDVIRLPKSSQMDGLKFGIIVEIINDFSCSVIPYTDKGEIPFTEYSTKRVPTRRSVMSKNKQWDVIQKADSPDIFED